MNISLKTIKKSLRLMALILATALLLTCSVWAADDEQASLMDRLLELDELIYYYAVEGVESPLISALEKLLEENPKLFDSLVDKLFADLDTYSRYITQEEYERAYPTGLPFVGIGITIDTDRPLGLVVAGLVTGGPAQEAGLQPGDVIVSIDGLDVTVFPWEAAANLVRGAEGTNVVLMVRRDGQPALIRMDITRQAMQTSNIYYEYQGDGVGYIAIYGFGGFSDYANFVDTIEEIPYDDDVRSLIIDLRGNPGGDLDAMYNMLNLMIPDEGVTLFTVHTNEESEAYTSTGALRWASNKVIVLVDETSASASEVFAGSLQALGYADCIGMQSFGKGIGQYAFDVAAEHVAVITSMKVELPVYGYYHGKGITPRYEVPLAQQPYVLPDLSPLDTQTAVFPLSQLGRVCALEERLAALGYFLGEPDNTYDAYTQWVVNQWQADLHIKQTAYAGVQTLAAIETELSALCQTQVTVDTQLDMALELAREAAKKPRPKPLPKR